MYIHRLRLQRDRRHRHQHVARLFDLHLARAHEAAQLFPHQRVGHQIAQVQQQEATVRTDQAARPHAREVGQHHVFFGLVLDPPEQGVVDRVVFDDDRRTGELGVVHHQVDPVTQQQLRQGFLAVCVVSILRQKELQVLEHILRHLIEVAAQLDRVLDLFFQLDADGLQLVIDQRLDDLPPECGETFVHGAKQRPCGLQETRNLVPQILLGLIHLGATFLGQGAGFVFGQGAALGAAQREHQAARFAVQVEAMRIGEGIELGVGLGLFGLVDVLDALAVGLEVFTFQTGRDFGLQKTDKSHHQLPKLAPLPGWHAQRARPVGRLEVVQVAQVGRHGPLGGDGLGQLSQQRGASAPHLAQHKQVVVGLLHGKAKARGLFGAFLTDPGQGRHLQVSGGSESQ